MTNGQRPRATSRADVDAAAEGSVPIGRGEDGAGTGEANGGMQWPALIPGDSGHGSVERCTPARVSTAVLAVLGRLRISQCCVQAGASGRGWIQSVKRGLTTSALATVQRHRERASSGGGKGLGRRRTSSGSRACG